MATNLSYGREKGLREPASITCLCAFPDASFSVPDLLLYWGLRRGLPV